MIASCPCENDHGGSTLKIIVSIKIKRKNCCGARYNLLSEMDFLSHTLPDLFPRCSLNRSGFKISDQVQGQGVRPIEKAQHTDSM